MLYDHYENAGPLFVRMAGAPRTRYALPGTADPLTRVRALAADPPLREAVQVASGSLAGTLGRIDAGEVPTPKNLAGTALSLTRYALRHSGRPTPFGLFAGVTTAGTGPARFTLTGPGRKAARIDGAWLDARIHEWLRLPEVRRRVDVVVNNLCRTRGNRLLLPTATPARKEISVRRNALVTWVCTAAAAPVPYTRLLEQAAAAFPQLPDERVDAVLAQLVRHGFLLTSIDQPGAALDRVEAAVAAAPGAAERLRGAREALRAYERTAPGEGGGAWHRVLDALSADPAANPPAHVDLGVDADVSVPPEVIEEARAYASAMWTVSPPWAALPHMRDYRDAFIDRYGVTAQIPLGELVDPHRGLGYPSAYRDGAPAGPDGTARRKVIAELVQEALATEDGELRLDAGTLALLAVDELTEDERRALPPHSLELCFQLLADSADTLDRGEFRLVAGPHTGSWTAGATAGRFAELTGTTEELAGLLGSLDDGRYLPAQVLFRPHDPHTLNPLHVPRLLPHRIPVGVHSDPTDPGHLDWRTLLVGVDAAGMRLTDPVSGRPVLPIVPHLVNPHKLAPDAARLIIDIGTARTRVWTGWDWYGLEDLPALPRVTFGRVTLCPRRWKPDRHLRAAAASEPSGWDAALTAWRQRYRVPERVQLVREDRGFGLDLTDRWHRTVLRQEVRGGSPFILVEDPTADGTGLGWSHGHRTEVLIPLVHRPRTEPPVTPPPVPSPAAERHLPGEDWLYAKLYATEDVHDELLTAHLPRLLETVGAHVDHWFFLRYRDPDPHLRLRLHGGPESLPELARWARSLQNDGLIRGLTLDTYVPETNRYGGPEALPRAERVFHLDSLSVIGLLRSRTDLPDEVLAAAHHAVLLESLGDWDWCAWVDRVFTKGPAHTAFQRHRALAREVIRPGRAAETLAGRLSGWTDLWTDAKEAVAYGDLVLDRDANPLLALLHMQHNRLLGIDLDREERGYAILRGIAREELGRRRHAR
ncbi:lantibiotic dehydratase [Streptomyces thioluteus]|uniref:Lantibiotic dehydratase n=1 Tax=Streptomyces thioluteus TaxID=66431 RepID=A0ABP6JGU6_STRTU